MPHVGQETAAAGQQGAGQEDVGQEDVGQEDVAKETVQETAAAGQQGAGQEDVGQENVGQEDVENDVALDGIGSVLQDDQEKEIEMLLQCGYTLDEIMAAKNAVQEDLENESEIDEEGELEGDEGDEEGDPEGELEGDEPPTVQEGVQPIQGLKRRLPSQRIIKSKLGKVTGMKDVGSSSDKPIGLD